MKKRLDLSAVPGVVPATAGAKRSELQLTCEQFQTLLQRVETAPDVYPEQLFALVEHINECPNKEADKRLYDEALERMRQANQNG